MWHLNALTGAQRMCPAGFFSPSKGKEFSNACLVEAVGNGNERQH